MLVALVCFIAFVVLATFISGLVTLLRDPIAKANRWFFALTTLLSLWIACNFIGSTLHFGDITQYFVKLDYAFALMMSWTMLVSISTLLSSLRLPVAINGSRSLAFIIPSLIANIAIGVMIFLDKIVKVSFVNNDLRVDGNSLVIFYNALIVAYLGAALINVYWGHKKAEDSNRHAMRLIGVGFFVAIVANILTNIVSPAIFTHRSTIEALNIIGYSGLLVLALSIYASFMRGRLFDIKATIVRTLSYLFLTFTLVLVYVVIGFGITGLIFSGQSLDVGQRVVYLISSILVAMTFQPIRRFFDKTLNKIFYQDAYDPQVFLDKMNNTLSSSVEIRTLAEQSIDVISMFLKPEFCVFYLNKTQYVGNRRIGDERVEISSEELKEIQKISHIKNKNVLLTDRIADTDESYKLHKALKAKNVGVVIRLVKNGEYSSEGIGNIFLGYKKSGNPYNRLDERIITIIANELTIAIQNSLQFEEIEKFNITLQEKIEAATKELTKTNEKLRALDQAKDEFISMASHQLRTPLTSMKGYVSMVLDGDAGKLSKMQKQLLDQAFSSSQRMVFLVTDLLNVSRLKTGKFVIENKPTNLADVVEGEARQLADAAKTRELTLTYDKPKDFPIITVDENKIRQVIMNFMDNAIYYTPAGGKIKVELSATKDAITYKVIDNGIGVPKHQKHQLFSKFYRADNARKARPDGTGLGLFMAKKVIVAQGGSLIFESEEGKGSTFGFILPRKKLEATKD